MKKLLSLFLALTLLLPVLAFAELDEEDFSYDDIVEEIDLDDVPEETSSASGYIEMTDEMSDELLKSLEAEDGKTADIDLDSLYINPNLPDHVINILLLGVDTREDTLGEGDHTVKRADVQIILSFNTETGELKLTSIPRDTLVTNPATGKLIPITNAYTSFDDKGVFNENPTRAMAVVNYNFEMNIRYFFSINFYGVVKIVESLGGVDVDLTEAEAWSINTYLSTKTIKSGSKVVSHGKAILRTYGKEFGLPEPLEVKAGVQHLTGLQALIYARLRETVRKKYPLGGDWQRTVRTRHLLELLLRKALQLNIGDMLNLLIDATAYMYTNMNGSDIYNLFMAAKDSGLLSMDTSGELFQQFRVPMDGTWSYNDGDIFISRKNGNFQKNIQALHEFIYGEGNYYPANP